VKVLWMSNLIVLRKTDSTACQFVSLRDAAAVDRKGKMFGAYRKPLVPVGWVRKAKTEKLQTYLQ
jgi:hypothetical protein